MEVNVLVAIIGVCGTLLGTILGFTLNFLSNKGRVRIYSKLLKLNTFLNDNKESTNLFFSLEGDFIITNTSSEIKTIIKPFFIIKSKEEQICKAIVKNIESPFTFDEMKKQYSKVENQYTLLPKSSLFIVLSTQNPRSNKIYLCQDTKFYLCYTKTNNKIKRIKLNIKYQGSKEENNETTI